MGERGTTYNQIGQNNDWHTHLNFHFILINYKTILSDFLIFITRCINQNIFYITWELSLELWFAITMTAALHCVGVSGVFSCSRENREPWTQLLQNVFESMHVGLIRVRGSSQALGSGTDGMQMTSWKRHHATACHVLYQSPQFTNGDHWPMVSFSDVYHVVFLKATEPTSFPHSIRDQVRETKRQMK